MTNSIIAIKENQLVSLDLILKTEFNYTFVLSLKKSRMKFILNIFFIFFTLSFYGQGESIAVKQYELAVTYFQEGKLTQADSLFTLSIESEPNPDAYYNKAIVNKKLGNSTVYCENLNNAVWYEDKEASKLYTSDCVIIDTFFVFENYKKASPENYFYKLKFIKSKYSSDQKFYRYDNRNKLDLAYEIVNHDTAYISFPKAFMDSILTPTLLAINKIVFTEIHYPELEKEKQISGTVFLQFYINKIGITGDIKILRTPTKGLAAEAARLVKLLPTLNPIIYMGKPVKMQMNLPIKFTLR
jgi:tetratricopeptide (TPR) repeat protein